MGDLLKDKVAVITGAGRGIGRGVAKLMAEEGAKVVVADLGVNVDGSGEDQSPAAQVVREIQDTGGTAVACYENVALMEGGERIVQSAIDNFGKLDIVVTPAGILRDRMVFNMTEQEWDDVIAVHMKGTFHGGETRLDSVPSAAFGKDNHLQLHLWADRQLRSSELRGCQGRHRRIHPGRRP